MLREELRGGGSVQRAHGSGRWAWRWDARGRGTGPHGPPLPGRAPPRPAGFARAQLRGGWASPSGPRPTPASPSSPPVALLVST